MELSGIHHVTAITSSIKKNFNFYTEVLGLRLVKKSVNQDQVNSYHLFYADKIGSPGTDITFFDWKAPVHEKGADSISRISFKVPERKVLEFWHDRFSEYKISTTKIFKRDNRETLDFTDPEGLNLSLVVDEHTDNFVPWENSSVASKFQIQGIGATYISVSTHKDIVEILENVLGFEKLREYFFTSPLSENNSFETFVYKMKGESITSELHVIIDPSYKKAVQGAGGVHHLAFRISDSEDHERWIKRLNDLRVPNSGSVDRFYFKSIYFRLPNKILFELATDEPGFAVDENVEELGQKLALPPFLEEKRKQIESNLPVIGKNIL